MEFLLVCPVVFQGILTAAVQEKETFSFCMCNPPFFQSLQEAGRNPSTAYGGATAPMSCLCCLWHCHTQVSCLAKALAAIQLQFCSLFQSLQDTGRNSSTADGGAVSVDLLSLCLMENLFCSCPACQSCNLRAPCYLGGGLATWGGTKVTASGQCVRPAHIFSVVFNRLATTQAQPTEVPPVLAVLGMVLPKFCPGGLFKFCNLITLPSEQGTWKLRAPEGPGRAPEGSQSRHSVRERERNGYPL